MTLVGQSHQQSWPCCAHIGSRGALAPSCPLHSVASGLGSAATCPGDISCTTQHRDPLLLSKSGHTQTFSGDTPALPHMLAGRQGQEGMGGVPGLPCPDVGHHPLSTSSMVPGEGGGPRHCLSSVQGQQGWCAVGDCPSLQVAMPHQWLEGNLPVSARCAVCDRTCGSVRRLQDWRCLWCKAIVRTCLSLSSPHMARTMLPLLGASLGKLRLGAWVLHPRALLMHVSLCPQVHSACKELFGKRCPLGHYKVSIIPPTALNSIDSDGESWRGQG